MFAEALSQGAGGLSYVMVIAGSTRDMVNGPTLVFFLLFVFWFHQERPQGVERFVVYGHPMVSEYSLEFFR